MVSLVIQSFFDAPPAHAQPASLSGTHLRLLDDNTFYSLGTFDSLRTMAWSRAMVAGAAILAFVDTAIYCSDAVNECWQARSVNRLVECSLNDAMRHLALAIVSITIGILFPALAIQFAYKIDILRPRQVSSVSQWLPMAMAGVVCFSVVRAAIMSEAERAYVINFSEQTLYPIFMAGVKPLSDCIGGLNLLAMGVTACFLGMIAHRDTMWF